MSERPTLELSRSYVCEHCGMFAHEHDKERVTHGNGTYSYNYICKVNT